MNFDALLEAKSWIVWLISKSKFITIGYKGYFWSTIHPVHSDHTFPAMDVKIIWQELHHFYLSQCLAVPLTTLHFCCYIELTVFVAVVPTIISKVSCLALIKICICLFNITLCKFVPACRKFEQAALHWCQLSVLVPKSSYVGLLKGSQLLPWVIFECTFPIEIKKVSNNQSYNDRPDHFLSYPKLGIYNKQAQYSWLRRLCSVPRDVCTCGPPPSWFTTVSIVIAGNWAVFARSVVATQNPGWNLSG